MNTIISSSVKLQFNNIIEIRPYIIMQILGQEFVTTDEDITGFPQVGIVQFGKVAGKIIFNDVTEETYYIQLEDGRIYSLTNLY